jgi:AcrR family transcriptional regulator
VRWTKRKKNVMSYYMNRKKTAKRAPARAHTYHHGDLRAALLDTARDVLETAPPDAITLKSLAERLGVTQSAPYRHFETREAVLAAVAADGFSRFREMIIAARTEAPEAERFERACLAYLAFGRANRGVYKLMFASKIVPTSRSGALGDAANSAFELLMGSTANHAIADQAHSVAMWVWSTLHGLVMLEADDLMKGSENPAATSAAVIRRLVRAVRAS